MAEDELVLVERDASVAIITNNRPGVLNATSDAFNRRLWECFAEVRADPDVRAVVWRGNGAAFSSGRDLKELGGPRDHGMSHLQHIERGHAWTQMLLTCPAPIICAVKGWCIGGMFERVLLCDLRVAGESARFWLPEMTHGVVPDSGGVARLFQIAGHGLAADLAMTARVLDAAEALTHGVVSRVVADEDVDETALAMARQVADLPPLVVKMFRRDLARLASPAVRASLEEEALMQAFVYASEDFQEMKRAKADGRDPVYRNR